MEEIGPLLERIAEQKQLARQVEEIEREIVGCLRAPQFRSLNTAVEALPGVLRKIAEQFGSKYIVVYIGDKLSRELQIELDRFAASNETDCHLPDEIVLNIGMVENQSQYSADCGLATLTEILSPKPQLYEIYDLTETKVCLIVCGWAEDRPITETSRLALEWTVREIGYALLNATKLDEALEREERIKTLADQMRHQLNAPLQGIRGSLGRLRSLLHKNASQEQIGEAAERADMFAAEAGSIVDKLAHATHHRGAPTRRPIFRKTNLGSVCRVAAMTYSPVAKERGINIEVEESVYRLPNVECDRGEIATLFANLIENAVKYSHFNKTVRLFGSIAVLPCPVSNLNQEAVRVTIQDFGLGIPKEDLEEKIFRPWFQSSITDERRSIAGTGLGLFVAREIAHEHGGKIYVSCKMSHRKTCLTFGVPLSDTLQGCLVEATVILPVRQILR